MKFIFFIPLFLLSVFTYAGTDIPCKGTVTQVLADHPGCGGKEFIAFRLTNTNEQWICTTSETGVSTILTAILSGNEVQATIDSNTGTQNCNGIVAYSPVDYIILMQ